MAEIPSSVRCIVNPSSGQDEPVLAALNRAWGDRIDWRVELTRDAGDGTSLAREAVADGASLVAVYGGDGTVAEVASGLAGSGVCLAILPGGTGNAVAQDLGLPTDLEAAARLAVSEDRVTRHVDGMRRDGQLFLHRFGCGAEARAIGGASRERKDAIGWLAYLEGAVQQIRSAQPLRFSFEAEDAELELEAVSCAVANVGRIGRGGFRFSQAIDPGDGWLDLLVVRRWDVTMLGAAGLRLLGFDAEPKRFGDPPGDEVFVHYRVRNVRITTDTPTSVHGDGDALDDTPLEISIDPGAVEVVVAPDGCPSE